MKRHLLLIDPQEDFCNPATGALYVQGAEHDIARLTALVARVAFDQVHVTLDTHHLHDIAHPLWWQDDTGTPPAPFTIITADDVAAGRWRTADPAHQARSLAYVQALEANGRYPLCVWPPHCLIGSVGNAVAEPLFSALMRLPQPVHFIRKGENPFTEHYSAIAADVPDPTDLATLPNQALLSALAGADDILIGGEAGSHCVANTVRDLLAHGIPAATLVLLTDTFSPVPGFEALQEAFLTDLRAAGARTATTEEIR